MKVRFEPRPFGLYDGDLKARAFVRRAERLMSCGWRPLHRLRLACGVMPGEGLNAQCKASTND